MKPGEQKPSPMKVLVRNIPEDLRAGEFFVNWNWEWKETKWDKPLYNPASGRRAKTNDPTTWNDFDTVYRAYQDGKFDGVGRVFSKTDPYTGIDLDKCWDAFLDEPEQWAREAIDLLDSYAEKSPSGGGIKVWVKGKLPPGGRRTGNIEMYDSGRYFTLTGHILNGTYPSVGERQDQLEELHAKYFPQKTGVENDTTPPVNNTLEDTEIIEKAHAAKDGGKFSKLWAGDWESSYVSPSEADQALCNKLAFWVGPNPARIDALFRQSGLARDKWDREDYRDRTIEKALSLTTERYNGPKEPAHNVQPVEVETVPEPKDMGFPDWIMTGVAGEFAKLYSTYLEVPQHFFYMAFLGCLGSVLSESLTLASEIYPQPRLYLIFLGESADDRKSTALQKTIYFFKNAVDGFQVCWGVGSAEGLQKKLSADNKLVLCFDEFKQFVGKCQAQASVLLPCVNTLFESNWYENHTKTSHVQIENARLTLMAASTIRTYENTWSSQFTDIGFNNRLFLVPGTARRRFSLPAKIPDNETYLLTQKLAEILRHVGEETELDITPEARELYHTWYMDLERSVHAKRLDVYALRLMPLLAANDLKEIIDTQIVEKVTDLCDWQFNVRALHDPIDADNKVAQLEQKIRRQLKTKGSLSDWELKQATNANRDGLWFYEAAKQNLIKAEEIGTTQGKYCART